MNIKSNYKSYSVYNNKNLSDQICSITYERNVENNSIVYTFFLVRNTDFLEYVNGTDHIIDFLNLYLKSKGYKIPNNTNKGPLLTVCDNLLVLKY
jgi:hypothetical protein